MILMGVHRGMVGLGLWRGAQWGEGLWGVARVWVSRGSMGGGEGGSVGKNRVGLGPRWGAKGWEALWGAAGMGPWGGEGVGHWSWERGCWGFVPG